MINKNNQWCNAKEKTPLHVNVMIITECNTRQKVRRPRHNVNITQLT